ncbi:hypothetical protein VNO77_02302 [Canavalia gladiata]|uniref:Uncharacterized protein n=1 Tax=Canavalia gladiata TaxID=3824 RepID=A0AAN9R5T1_CANGL
MNFLGLLDLPVIKRSADNTINVAMKGIKSWPVALYGISVFLAAKTNSVALRHIEANGNSRGSTWGDPKAHSSDKDLPLLAIDLSTSHMSCSPVRLCLGHVGHELGHRPASTVIGPATTAIFFLACQSNFLGSSEYRSVVTQFGPAATQFGPATYSKWGHSTSSGG